MTSVRNVLLDDSYVQDVTNLPRPFPGYWVFSLDIILNVESVVLGGELDSPFVADPVIDNGPKSRRTDLGIKHGNIEACSTQFGKSALSVLFGTEVHPFMVVRLSERNLVDDGRRGHHETSSSDGTV